MEKIITIYFQHVEQLRVDASLSLTATNSEGPVSTLQTDHVAEFTASGFQQHVLDHRVLRRFTAPGLHRNNSFVESYRRSYLANVRASLFTANWSTAYWRLASNHTMWLANRTDQPTPSSRRSSI